MGAAWNTQAGSLSLIQTGVFQLAALSIGGGSPGLFA